MRCRPRFLRFCCAFVTSVFAGALAPHPAASADFYLGKTLNVVIGYSAGGGYDLYARVLAKHLGKHIPRNPTVLPLNMVGPASLRPPNYAYSLAPNARTFIRTSSPTAPIAPLLSSS